jgi:hypothetical protein
MNVAITFVSFTTSSQFTQVFARDRGYRVPEKKCTTQILWHIASKLYQGKEIIQASGDSDITGHFLMGRTCVGSERSSSSGHPDPQDIVVDKTLAL